MDKYQPKPLTENHPHIQFLINAQEKRTKDRVQHRNREKLYAERNEEIDKAPDSDVKDFWCLWCDKDFKALAIKHTEVDWSNTSQRVAYYKTKHECGNWVIRHITDKHSDPYWFESRSVALDRGNHHNDLIQEFETGYQLLYGRKNT